MTRMRSILILLILLLGAGRLSSGQTGENLSCEQALDKVTAYYTNNYLQDKVHVVYTVQNIEDGEKSLPLKNNLYRDGERLRYENPYILVFQDREFRVTIFKEREMIFVQRVKEMKENTAFDEISGAAQLDSLTKYSSAFWCSGEEDNHQITVTYPEEIKGEKQLVSSVRLTIDPATGAILHAVYDFYRKDGVTRQIYSYGITGSEPEFNGSALEQVWEGEEIRPEYKDFKIMN